MPGPSPATADPVPPQGRPGDLHIVLFGLPAAGKSSLLGALGQASAAQEHLLAGRLTDLTAGLAELRQRTYDEAPRRTADEVVPYPVDYEPFNRAAQQPGRHIGAVFIDCDGRVANDLLVRQKELDERSPEGTLAREVIDADAILLIIDASAPPTQIEADFAEFERFLIQMEAGRARRAEVAGLPVFLVLTKCDLLARPGDNSADWMERIEQRKRDVDARFRGFLARRASEGAGPVFGRIDLHLWATAVKRPALAGSPPRPREPYGVAELFRLCLDEASAHRERTRRAARRLMWTVGASVALVTGLLGVSAGLLIEHRARKTDVLAGRVADQRLLDRSTAAERLRPSAEELKARQEILRSIRDDPLFEALPRSDREFVQERLDELNSYLSYLQSLRALSRPMSLTREADLEKLKTRLESGDLALPSEEWADTETGRLHRELLNETKELLAAVVEMRKAYEDSRTTVEGLALFDGYKVGADRIDWESWTAKVEEELVDSGKRIRRKGPRYEAALKVDTVVAARGAWESEATSLRRLFDVAAALGLARPADRPPVLVIPRTGALAQLRTQLEELKKAYPNYKDDFKEAARRLPAEVEGQVRLKAAESYAALLDRGHAAVLNKLRVGGALRETAKRWEGVRVYLESSPAMAALGELGEALTPLTGRKPKNPVRELAAFLGKTSWAVGPRTVTLAVPKRLRPADGASFKVNHPDSGREPAMTFALSGAPTLDKGGRLHLYRYRRTGSESIAYRPGEKLWAYVEMSDGRYLTWSESPSQRDLILRLRQPPHLRSADDDLTAGPVQVGVNLTFTPDEVPSVPDLMPRIPRAP
jgi:hypothetical protein